MPIETLEAFYEAMNGDEWHRNDGWLAPEVDVCDWYGITCVTEFVETGNFEWIGYIHLADNRLEAGYLHDFEAMSRVDWSHLNLAGNDFTGEWTTDIFTAQLYRRDHGNIGGGLDVCFNDFIIDNPDIEQWIADRHVGGPDYHLARPSTPMQSSTSIGAASRSVSISTAPTAPSWPGKAMSKGTDRASMNSNASHGPGWPHASLDVGETA